MTKFNRRQIQKAALKYLSTKPEGARWTDILRHIHDESPETPQNSIQGGVHNLISNSTEIERIGRGVYRLSTLSNDGDDGEATPEIGDTRFGEVKFYEPFADWLVTEAGEANCAIPLGGNWLKGKWGTPDVLGVMKPLSDDILAFDTQIVAAEIKEDHRETVTAFGQAVAYRLFAHKSYIVLPGDTSPDDLARLKALCGVHGLGLVVFDRDPSAPNFVQIVAPTMGIPDMLYANRMAHQLRQSNLDAYRKLFN